MPKVLNFFDDAYYINLDSRTDRKIKFEKNSEDLGLLVKRFSAYKPKINEIPPMAMMVLDTYYPKSNPLVREDQHRKMTAELGCCLSHRAVVKEAKDRGLNNVLIFEDDCIFLPEWKSEIEKVVNDLKTIEWDLIYFGGNLTTPILNITENLGSVTGPVWAAHAYAVNRSFFDTIIDVDVNQLHFWMYDVFLISNWSTKKYIASKKILCVQDSDWSDITGRHTGTDHEVMIDEWNMCVSRSQVKYI